jgi:hypothetical protein
MLSAQGQSTKMSNGFTVKQTIGQQSITGSSSKTHKVIQGFQQSLWSKYINSNVNDTPESINAFAYPNPFTETINFQFSKPINEVVSVFIFDITGRIIYNQNKKVDNQLLTIDLSGVPSSEYLVRLITTKLNYYTKIIKK